MENNEIWNLILKNQDKLKIYWKKNRDLMLELEYGLEDFVSDLQLRIVEQFEKFDEKKSKLNTWFNNQIRWSSLYLLRDKIRKSKRDIKLIKKLESKLEKELEEVII